MTEPDGYATWSAIEQTLKATAVRDRPVGDQLTQARFDRFLSRVFADGPTCGWLLKGGTGILARVPNARSTQDVDLASSIASMDNAVDDLQRRASVDLVTPGRTCSASSITPATAVGVCEPHGPAGPSPSMARLTKARKAPKVPSSADARSAGLEIITASSVSGNDSRV